MEAGNNSNNMERLFMVGVPRLCLCAPPPCHAAGPTHILDFFGGEKTSNWMFNSLSTKFVLAGEKLVAMYSIST